MTQEVDPAGDESRTLYDVLLVHPRAPECVIQAAYRALARLHHPDVSPSEADAERMREINAAHTVLSDPKRRAEYDLSLLQRSTSGGGTPRRAGARRERGCWKCGRPLDLLAPYCGACRWVVCAGCKTCGCTHPSRRQAQEKERISRKGRVVVVGLVVAAALVVLNRSPQIADRKASSAPAATAVVATATAAPAPVVTTITSGASNGAAPATSEADRQLGTPLSGAPFLNDPSSTPPPTATRATAAPTSPVVEMADGGASGSDGIASSVLPPNPAADVIPTAPPVATAAPTANASVAPTPAEESRSSRVATGGLGARVRAEPDPIAPILVVLVDGTRVTELGLEEARGGRTWREIRTPGGATGWIDTNLLARAD